MSLNYFENKKYEICPLKYKIESEENNLRKQLHQFEFSPLKSKNSTLEFQKNVIQPSLNRLNQYRQEIKGFSFDSFLISFVICHTLIIYKKKVLLNEMQRNVLPHLGICFSFGLFNGFIIGNKFAKSFSLYRTFSRVNKRVRKINSDFENFYIMKHEEEFDE